MEASPRSNCGQNEVIDHEPVEVCGSLLTRQRTKLLGATSSRRTSVQVGGLKLFRDFELNAVSMHHGTANEFHYWVKMMVLLLLLLMLMIVMMTILVIIIIPCGRVLLEKLTVPQIVKNFSSFYENEGSLPFSQELATCPSPEPDQSSPLPTSYL